MKLVEKFSTRLNNEHKEKVREALEIAKSQIKEKFWNAKLENVVVDVKVPYRRISSNMILCGWYDMKEDNKIVVCTSALKKSHINAERIARTIIHELGHLIHDNLLGFQPYEFSTIDKTKYAYTNYKEDFAEAFVDYILDRTEIRAKEMKNILNEYNDLHRVVTVEVNTNTNTHTNTSKKAKVYVVGSQHVTAKGLIEITRIFVENGIEMIEYKNLKTGEILVNKKVNLVSNIRKYATRMKNKGVN